MSGKIRAQPHHNQDWNTDKCKAERILYRQLKSLIGKNCLIVLNPIEGKCERKISFENTKVSMEKEQTAESFFLISGPQFYRCADICTGPVSLPDDNNCCRRHGERKQIKRLDQSCAFQLTERKRDAGKIRAIQSSCGLPGFWVFPGRCWKRPEWMAPPSCRAFSGWCSRI